MKKEEQQPPRLISFAKIWSEHVLKIKTKSHKVWAEVSDWQLSIWSSGPMSPPGPDRVNEYNKYPRLRNHL